MKPLQLDTSAPMLCMDAEKGKEENFLKQYHELNTNKELKTSQLTTEHIYTCWHPQDSSNVTKKPQLT